MEPGQPSHDARRLRAQQLGGVGVLLLRHQARPRCEGVGHPAEAELGCGPQHDLPAQLRQVPGAGGGRAQVVEHEVSVRNRVERVLRDRAEAELLRDEHAAGVEVHPGESARAERQLVGGGHAEVESLRVAPELPEPGQQVVGQVDRLGALHVGVAGQRPVEVALRQLDERGHQRVQQRARLEAVGAHEHRHVGGHLVVARAGGVEPAARRAGDLRQAPLDRHVDVLVVIRDNEAVLLDLIAHGGEALLDLRQVLLLEDAGARQHARVGERLLDVVRRQPVVEGDRRVQRLEERILGVPEAAHRDPAG